MANFLRGALIGAIALGGLAAASTETSAMPVGNLAPVATEAGLQSNLQNVYWRYGYGWRRPWGWRYGYGWHRPWARSFYHPWGWGGYRVYGWRRWHHWRRW